MKFFFEYNEETGEFRSNACEGKTKLANPGGWKQVTPEVDINTERSFSKILDACLEGSTHKLSLLGFRMLWDMYHPGEDLNAPQYSKRNNSCMRKSFDDEPLFVIRAKDPAAILTIKSWLQHRGELGIHTGVKATGAWDCIQAMIDWQEKYPEHLHQ